MSTDDNTTPPPAGPPTFGASALFSGDATPPPPTETLAARGAAMAELAQLKANPEFQQLLLKGDANALAKVAQINRTVNSPTSVVVNGQPTPAEVQQRLDTWNNFASLDQGVIEQIRTGGSVTKAEYDLAKQEKSRLFSSKPWVAAYLDGGIKERQQMALISIILSSQIADAK
jgi:hypothetical protein